MDTSFKLNTITECSIRLSINLKILSKGRAFPILVLLFNKQLVLIIVERQTCKNWNNVRSSMNLKILQKGPALPVSVFFYLNTLLVLITLER